MPTRSGLVSCSRGPPSSDWLALRQLCSHGRCLYSGFGMVLLASCPRGNFRSARQERNCWMYDLFKVWIVYSVFSGPFHLSPSWYCSFIMLESSIEPDPMFFFVFFLHCIHFSSISSQYFVLSSSIIYLWIVLLSSGDRLR